MRDLTALLEVNFLNVRSVVPALKINEECYIMMCFSSPFEYLHVQLSYT